MPWVTPRQIFFFAKIKKLNIKGSEYMVTALINGVEEIFSEKLTLKEYLINRGYDISSVIVEYNFNILKSELWDSTGINDKDNIEILSFVGGG